MRSCSTALIRILLNQSRFLQPQSNVPFWPRLGRNKCGRSFGGEGARKLASCGPLVSACVIRTAGWRELRPILNSKNERCAPKAKLTRSSRAGRANLRHGRPQAQESTLSFEIRVLPLARCDAAALILSSVLRPGPDNAPSDGNRHHCVTAACGSRCTKSRSAGRLSCGR